MTSRRLAPGVIALLVVLGSLALGAAVVAVLVAVSATTSPDPVDPADPAVSVEAASGSPATTPEATTPAATTPQATTPQAGTGRAREVLRQWDRRREEAWTSADEGALAALYLPDAVAGQRDVELLRRWTARGARVVTLQTQVLELRVLHHTARTLVVRVTDRLGVLAAEVDGELITLPRDQATTRRIELRRAPRTTSWWRVAAVLG